MANVLGNRATGLLDMAIEAFKDKSMPNAQLAPTVPGANTVLRPTPTVQMNTPQVATIQTNPALNRMPSMPLGQGVRATPEMMQQRTPQITQQRTPSMPTDEGVRRPVADVMGMEKFAEDAAKVKKAIDDNPQLEQDPTFMDKVKGYFGNRENMVRLALAFNSMRLTPDQGLAAALSAEQKDLRAQSLQRQNATRTAAVVREKDPRLAALLEQGVIDAKTAIQLMYKKPSELTQMMELFESDPERFKAMAASGAFGGDVDLGQGTMFDEMAKTVIKNRDALIQGGTLAADLSRQLTRFQMQADGLETGPLENRLQALREFGASIGVPVNEIKLQQGQSLKAASMNLVANELRKNKGPQTNFDAEYTEGFVPSLGNTAAANEEIINYMQSANRIMTIYGEMAVDMPYQTQEADRFLVELQRSQMKTPAVSKFNGEWITFNEYYSEAKRLSRESGQPLTDIEILQQWKKDHEEKGEL